MNELPIVRLELTRMQHSICMMVSAHMMKLDKEAQAAVKAAVESFDYGGEVRRIAHDAIRSAIKHAVEEQFRYDGAPYKAIQEVARKMVEAAVKKEAK